MTFQPYINSINLSDSIKSFSPLSMPNFSFSYSLPSFLPSFANIWSPSYSSFSLPSYSGLFTTGLTGKNSNAYDFSFLNSSYRPSSNVAAGTVGRVSGKFSYKAVSGKAQRNLGPEFLARVKEVAQNINCDYKDLLAVMNSESGLNPSIQNQAGYQAYGLIQFTPQTASDLGTSVEKLVKMSAVEQLDYVEKFYLQARKTRGFGNKKFTAADLYAVTFLPARANQNVLCVKGERWESGRKKGQLKNWYEANTAFDKDGNHKIEKWELQERMNACRVNENIFLA